MTISVTDSTFESEVINSKLPVLVDFWAPWCGPCRAIAPVLDQISIENTDIKVVKINVDENPDTAVKFRIQSIPALMVFKDGKLVASRVGGASKDDLVKWVKSSS